MKNKRQITVVLDDGGGYAMAVWADRYAADCMIDGDQVAEMIISIMDNDDCSSWDNNEYANVLLYLYNVMAHAGNDYCRTYEGTALQVAREIIRDYKHDDIFGANHEELARALLARRDEWR
jgi:hypothetical protein